MFFYVWIISLNVLQVLPCVANDRISSFFMLNMYVWMDGCLYITLWYQLCPIQLSVVREMFCSPQCLIQ